jgi:DNA-directed RNA polymerase specialized sigma24 family protein
MAESNNSVSLWLEQLQAGDVAATQAIWERYFERLVRLVHARLPDRLRPAIDEEDVALSAFNSFFRGVEEGRFPKLNDRTNLWAVLVTIADRKRLAGLERENALKRGGRQQRHDIEFDLADPSPTPEFAAEVADECERMLKHLRQRDPELERIALLKLEGCTNAQIGELVQRSLATVSRKLELIRELWAGEFEKSSAE